MIWNNYGVFGGLVEIKQRVCLGAAWEINELELVVLVEVLVVLLPFLSLIRSTY